MSSLLLICGLICYINYQKTNLIILIFLKLAIFPTVSVSRCRTAFSALLLKGQSGGHLMRLVHSHIFCFMLGDHKCLFATCVSALDAGQTAGLAAHTLGDSTYDCPASQRQRCES